MTHDPLKREAPAWTAEALRDIADELLASAGSSDDARLEPLPGGANNRVFRVHTRGGDYLLKSYFRHPADDRDRLAHEFAFLSYAWRQGLRCVPRPLAQAPLHDCALYEFVDGRKLRPGEVAGDAVRQALSFYHALNRAKGSAEARRLPHGSEACFSLAAHVQMIEGRMSRLRQIATALPIERAAHLFIRRQLEPLWGLVRDCFQKSACRDGLPLDDEPRAWDCCVSPSDFGFHNALREPSGGLRFIDFEYAGWDDPLRLVCDFFCQPAVPVPLEYYPAFAQSVARDLKDPERRLRQMSLLLPLYRVKWCCIVLNHFLPVDRQRRRFASQEDVSTSRLQEQLSKAQSIAATVPALLASYDDGWRVSAA